MLAEGSRGTCAETEDATEIRNIDDQLHSVREALALEQRMQLVHGVKGTAKSTVREALALEQRMQRVNLCTIFNACLFERHLRWNRGCNRVFRIAMKEYRDVREALALEQRMQLII